MGDSLQDLINKVVQWGNDRNLNAPENLKAQTMKLVSEFGEIGLALAQNDEAEVIDGIGDTIVVAIIIGQQIGFPLLPSWLDRSDSLSFDGMRYEYAAGRLGLFVDSVLKGHSNATIGLLLREFVEAAVDFIRDWDLDDRPESRPEACLASAYNEIKDRKGVMLNGAFIKEADPRYADALRELGR
jgi:hypothetical protein